MRQQVSTDEFKASANASTPAPVVGDAGAVDGTGVSETSEATEDCIVSSLIGMGIDDTGPSRSSHGGEGASVPSAEEGLNLWESEGKLREATAPADMLPLQVMAIPLRLLVHGCHSVAFVLFRVIV